ncbi:cytochrome c-type biogenesis protein CcmE [Gammaproteobacteria bacterium]|nr:cytochrome c-type biogenesis protein CcmE [Gammaproteobacteria bacterium]
MSPRQRQRLIMVLSITTALALATGFVVYAFRQNLDHFYSPVDIKAGKAEFGKVIRVGGVVDNGSLKRDDKSLKVNFDISVNHLKINVEYVGILPDLFREGQGIIAKGTLTDSDNFVATEVLAKHDETYMPPEVADAIKNSTHTTKPIE